MSSKENNEEKSIKLYQLGEYNTKENLSIQSKTVRNHILKNRDFKTLYELILEYQELEFETVLILKKAINAGYWDSYYGFNWSKEQELQFWKTVQSKSKNLSISNLQLLRTKQSAGVKNAMELKEEYIKLLSLDPSLAYTIMNEDLDKIWEDDNILKEACLKATIIHYSTYHELDEFIDEANSFIKFHYKSEVPESLVYLISTIIKDWNSKS